MLSRSNRKVLGSLMMLSVLALSSLVALPIARGQTSSSIPSSPSLNTITLTSYAGNDQAGISDLVNNKILAYDAAVTPSEASTIPSSGFNQYVAPAAWYGLEINPTNTTDGFNPFQFQPVRYALNYLVGRNYFVNNLLGGDGIPTFSVFGGQPDQLVTSPATAQFSNITNSISIANSTIYTALIANGATFKWASTPQWYYNGKPIVVTVFDRTDDPVRHAYTGYLESQLRAVGFQVDTLTGTLANVQTEVYGTDPVNATWDIYPASYGNVYSYYDEFFAVLYAPIVGALPASSTLGLAFGTYNDTSYEQPSTVALLDTADKYAIDFFNTNFTSYSQRNAYLNDLVVAGIKNSVAIGLSMSLAPYAASSSLNGVTANFVNDPLLNALSFLTMNTASGTADIGVRHIAQSSLNPVGGYTDTYSVAWSEATSFPPVFYQPSTGYPYTVGWSFKVLNDSSTPTVAVPSTAVVMNATSDAFINVPSGTKAKTAVIANFAPMLSESWQDGQPLTLADILYQYILAGEVTQNPNSPVYDGYSSAIFGPSWQTLIGMKILNSTSIEVYSSFYYPDTYFAGINAAGALFAYTPTTGAQGMLPWQIYAGMANLVASGSDAWSSSSSTAENLPWLSLVNRADVSNLKAALGSYASSSYIPPEFASLQQLTGVTLVTPKSADSGYNAAVSFINKYGTGIIGNGPYILSDYSASTSPAYAVLTKNPDFTWGNLMSPQLGDSPVLMSQQASIPAILNPGQTITVTALQTPDGSKETSPAAGANVTLQFISNGAIAYQKSVASDSQGHVEFTVPATLPLGTYEVTLWTSTPSSTLYNPYTQVVQLAAANVNASSTTTSSSSSSRTSSSTTSSSSSQGASVSLSPTALLGMAVATAAIISVVTVGLSKRRGRGAGNRTMP